MEPRRAGRQTDYVYNAHGQLTEQIDPADANGVRRRTSTIYATSAGGISRRSAVRICADTGATCGTNAPIQTEYDYARAQPLLPSAERRIDVAQSLTLTTITATMPPAGSPRPTGRWPAATTPTYKRYDVHGRPAGTIGPDPDGAGAMPRLAVRTSYDSADRPIRVETGTIARYRRTCAGDWTGFTPVAPPRRSTTARAARSASSCARARRARSGRSPNIATTIMGRLECTAVRMNPAAFASLPASACTLGTRAATVPTGSRATSTTPPASASSCARASAPPTSGTEATWAYNLNGQVTTVIDGNGNRAELRYDGHGRQDRWTFPSRRGRRL